MIDTSQSKPQSPSRTQSNSYHQINYISNLASDALQLRAANPVPLPHDSTTEMAPSTSSAAASISPSTRQNPQDQDTIFADIYNYPWAQDSEFQSGLFSILGRDGEGSASSATNHDRDQGLDPDLLLQAQCFYFSQYSLLIIFLPLTRQTARHQTIYA